MSFLFGSRRGHGDPELERANLRAREHLARDINDQRLLAGGQLIGKRRTPWLLLAAVMTFFVLAAFVRGGSDPVPIPRSCTQPALALATSSVAPRSTLQVRSTGPQDQQYILALDGAPVQGQADGPVSYTRTDAGPAYTLTDCVSPAFLLQAPAAPGAHELSLIGYDGGRTQTVATARFTVTG